MVTKKIVMTRFFLSEYSLGFEAQNIVTKTEGKRKIKLPSMGVGNA